MRFIFLISNLKIRNLKRGSNQETYSKEKKREVKRRCDGGILDVVCFPVVKNANHHVFLLTNMGSFYSTRVFVSARVAHDFSALHHSVDTHTPSIFVQRLVFL